MTSNAVSPVAPPVRRCMLSLRQGRQGEDLGVSRLSCTDTRQRQRRSAQRWGRARAGGVRGDGMWVCVRSYVRVRRQPWERVWSGCGVPLSALCVWGLSG